MEIVIFGIGTVVGYAALAAIYAICYRMGQTVTRTELDAATNRTNARCDCTNDLVISTANQLRAEMAANRAELRQEMQRIAAVDRVQPIANHRHTRAGEEP